MTNNDRVAVVTGASTGIGLATARALAGAGYRVFGTSRRAGTNACDGVAMLSCDVTQDASVEEMAEEVLRKAGRIDLLVNNAGGGLIGGAEESSAKQAQDLFNVNLFGVVRVTNAVLPTMRDQGKGRIINISSVLGLIPAPFNALYTSTKHAVEGYSESLDHELRSFGIRVVVVEPGLTRTSFDQSNAKPDRPLAIYDALRRNAEILMATGLERGDAPEIVADTILKAATDPQPRRRYPAGKMARQIRLMRRFLPESVVDRNLRKFHGLPA